MQNTAEPTVTRAVAKGAGKLLSLSSGEQLLVPRFSPIGVGDVVRITGKGKERGVKAVCSNGEATILPSFKSTRSLPSLRSPLYINEVETDAELEAYQRLAGYHYRNQAAFGRKSVLVARVKVGQQSRVVGYIEITNTFIGHQARNAVLSAVFNDGNGISWPQWNLEAKKRYINTIARIARCVVHPEYRGVGVGKALCTGAIEFCKRSWNISRLRPSFLEITADMLKFVPFAKKAGMHYVGDTNGNLNRLVKDQTYLRGVKDDIGTGVRAPSSHAVFNGRPRSILQRQRRDVENMDRIQSATGNEMLPLLKTYISANSPEQLPSGIYELLHSIIRFPKPTFMIGLSPESQSFLLRRLEELGVKEENREPNFQATSLAAPICLDEVSISHSIAIPNLEWANAIQEAFGVHQNAIASTGISGISLCIQPREILYVWGPSGSGKSLFLDLIRGTVQPSKGIVRRPADASIGVLSLEFADRPVLLEVGGGSLSESLYVLNMVGLSEASLYFKSPKHLSNGQRYRLALARLMTSRMQVWLIDEFCSVLDDHTAEVIAWNVSRFARKLGVTAVLAGPRKDSLLPSMAPDRVLQLDALGAWHIESYP